MNESIINKMKILQATFVVLFASAALCQPTFGRPRNYDPEAWPVYHIRVLPDEGRARPYDTNGCIYWKGRYHLMYIFQDPTRQGAHCWGHVSSTDLVNWTYHPTALGPEPGDPDKGIYSGNAFVNKDGVPMLCYNGIGAGVCVATAEDDELIKWKKHPKNPIIPRPKKGQPGHGVSQDPGLHALEQSMQCINLRPTLPFRLVGAISQGGF